MRLAHLSDLHLFAEGALRFPDLASRRLVGALNLFFNRKGLHSPAVAEAAVEAVREARVDHCVVSGDLTNLALEGEFELAARILAPLGDREHLTVIPGNHDQYTPGAVRTRRFERWFGYSLWSGPDPATWCFPVVKDLVGGIRLIAVNSATPAPPACAFGHVGESQLAGIERALDEGSQAGRTSVVILHHNLHQRGRFQEWTGRLLDRKRFLDVVRAHGARLVLHGHDHREHEMTLGRGEAGRLPTLVLGCGSTTVLHGHGPIVGRFNIYEFDAERVRVERWRYRREEGRFRPEAG